MKVDLTTAIISAIIGVVIAYFITGGVLLKEPTPVNIKTITSSTAADLNSPNPEIFNYRALNPVVEVYIDCSNYDASGSCIDNTGAN